MFTHGNQFQFGFAAGGTYGFLFATVFSSISTICCHRQLKISQKTSSQSLFDIMCFPAMSSVQYEYVIFVALYYRRTCLDVVFYRISPSGCDHRHRRGSFRRLHCPNGHHQRVLLHPLPEKYVSFMLLSPPKHACQSTVLCLSILKNVHLFKCIDGDKCVVTSRRDMLKA